MPPAARSRLPRAVAPLALLGLAVLVFYTLPAVRKQHRLERDHARLERSVRATEAEVERLRRELRGGGRQPYLRIKATRDLMHEGATYIQERDAKLGR